MTVQKITPYFFFDGQADAAIELYGKALGARPEGVLRWGENPAMCPAGKEKHVMHAALHIGSALLMLSDSPEETPSPEQRRVAVAIEVDDPGEMQRQFDALSEGGKVMEKIHDAFWGDKFGVVRDRFGVTWMFTCPQKKG